MPVQPSWTVGDFNTGSGATFANQATSCPTPISTAVFPYNLGGAQSQFNNAGTFTKVAASADLLQLALQQHRHRQWQQRHFESCRGAAPIPAALSPGAAAQINFSGGTHDLNAGSSVSGAGTIGISGGLFNFNAGSYNVSGTTLIDGGDANFNSAATTNLLTLPSGILGGTGTLTASGLFTWSGGTINDSGTLQANGGMALSGALKAPPVTHGQ